VFLAGNPDHRDFGMNVKGLPLTDDEGGFLWAAGLPGASPRWRRSCCCVAWAVLRDRARRLGRSGGSAFPIAEANSVRDLKGHRASGLARSVRAAPPGQCVGPE